MSRSAGGPTPIGATALGDRRKLGQKLRLVCGQCGKRGNYTVCRVVIHPKYLKQDATNPIRFEELVYFSGIFSCRHCKASGPWEVPQSTRTSLLASVLTSALVGEEPQVHLGEMQLFDGTITQTGLQSVEHLQRRLEATPDNAFVWSRLGNVYCAADRFDEGRRAFERALDLDPADAELHHNLGQCLEELGELIGAAECYQRVCQHARSSPSANGELTKTIVRHALERLFDFHVETEGQVPFPPLTAPSAGDTAGVNPATISLVNLDLETEEGWEILTSICLTGKVPAPVRRRELSRLRGPAIEAGPPPPGRNEPCPCGSGKKYKRCCGRL